MSLPAVRSILLVLCLALLGIGLRPSGARGQNNRFTERAFVASPVVRGMGDAGVALPGVEQSFFYNPAHLPRVSSHFTILGVQGAASRTLDDQIRFFNQNVQPAVASNFDLSTAALADLYQKASALNQRPGRSNGFTMCFMRLLGQKDAPRAGGRDERTHPKDRTECGSDEQRKLAPRR